jgi:hypothetical protein
MCGKWRALNGGPTQGKRASQQLTLKDRGRYVQLILLSNKLYKMLIKFNKMVVVQFVPRQRIEQLSVHSSYAAHML